MPLNWTTTDRAGNAGAVKVLVYGPAGIGKTTLCQTAPRPLIISAEGGMLSLRKVSIPVLEVNEIGDLNDIFLWLTTNRMDTPSVNVTDF